jgi:hypothetical protein
LLLPPEPDFLRRPITFDRFTRAQGLSAMA